MSMALFYIFLTVGSMSKTSLFYMTRIASESHGSSLFIDSFLRLHDMYYFTGSFLGKFLTMRLSFTKNIAGKFDCHNLRTETNTKIWNTMGSSIFTCEYHPLDSSLSKTSGNTNPIKVLKHRNALFFYGSSIDKFKSYFLIKRETCCSKSFINRIVGILEVIVFSNHTDMNFLNRGIDRIGK